MKKLFIIILSCVAFIAHSQTETDFNSLPVKSTTDDAYEHIIIEGATTTYRMTTGVLLGDVTDSLDKHTDTLQLHQTQIAALYDTAAIHLDTLQDHNTRLLSVEGESDVWTKAGTDLSPTTAGDDILLSTSTERLTFGDGDTYLFENSDDNLRLFVGGGLKWIVSTGANVNYNTTYPGTTDTYDLGTSSNWWGDLYAQTVYYDDVNTRIFLSGTDLSFTDAVTGTKTLAELAAGGGEWTKTGTDLSPTTSGDDILLATNSEKLTFGDGDTWIEERVDDNLEFYMGSSIMMYMSNAQVFVYGSILPVVTDADIGSIADPFENGYFDKAIKQAPISHSLTDGAPTDAEIDAATGTTPSVATSGWKRLILDSDGSALMYIIISDGTNWQYTALTIAL